MGSLSLVCADAARIYCIGGTTMRRKTLFLAALLLAIAVTGCRKKETIDLSTLHTTAAETENQSEEEPSKEPIQLDTEHTESSSETEHKYSVDISMETYTDGGVSIQYPVLSSLSDQELQEKINQLIKENAVSAARAKGLPAEGASLTVSASVESSNLKRLVLSYKGELKKGADTERIFYSNTIDLEEGRNLQLSDYADAYTVAGYLASGDYVFAEAPKGDEAAVRAYINGAGRDTDYYYKKLTEADFSETGAFPEYCSFERQGTIFVSVPVSHELGDYALIKYVPDNK